MISRVGGPTPTEGPPPGPQRRRRGSTTAARPEPYARQGTPPRAHKVTPATGARNECQARLTAAKAVIRERTGRDPDAVLNEVSAAATQIAESPAPSGVRSLAERVARGAYCLARPTFPALLAYTIMGGFTGGTAALIPLGMGIAGGYLAEGLTQGAAKVAGMVCSGLGLPFLQPYVESAVVHGGRMHHLGIFYAAVIAKQYVLPLVERATEGRDPRLREAIHIAAETSAILAMEPAVQAITDAMSNKAVTCPPHRPPHARPRPVAQAARRPPAASEELTIAAKIGNTLLGFMGLPTPSTATPPASTAAAASAATPIAPPPQEVIVTSPTGAAGGMRVAA